METILFANLRTRICIDQKHPVIENFKSSRDYQDLVNTVGEISFDNSCIAYFDHNTDLKCLIVHLSNQEEFNIENREVVAYFKDEAEFFTLVIENRNNEEMINQLKNGERPEYTGELKYLTPSNELIANLTFENSRAGDITFGEGGYSNARYTSYEDCLKKSVREIQENTWGNLYCMALGGFCAVGVLLHCALEQYGS